jgi:hypothetical protein
VRHGTKGDHAGAECEQPFHGHAEFSQVD